MRKLESLVRGLKCPSHKQRLVVECQGELGRGVPWPVGVLQCPSGCTFPIRGGIPRFTDRDHYAEPFGLQWRRYQKTQLDSYTGLPISRERLERCLGMPLEALAGKRILECGSGAGRFTELLLGRGDLLVSLDLSDAVDANLKNCGGRDPYLLIQADINSSPLPKRSFDVCICLGVLQHTPSPEQAIRSLVEHLAPGGLLVIDHYTRYSGPLALSNYLTLGYPLRHVFKRLGPEAGLRATTALTAFCDPIRRRTCRVHWLDRIASRFFPMICYYNEYPGVDPKIVYDLNELDTHDALTDFYKHRRTRAQIDAYLKSLGLIQVECSKGGIGVEARAIVPPDERCPSSATVNGMVLSGGDLQRTS
ncbi:class I SAM-dependent methyltransferase [Singulisphaera sp. Ch08]|uniref:Class I SAM-dependent methyltransferase n=1 Tax=Singulisphaera sp. Ch08 TaxID=3120278 RepID=A0AAU7CDP8_9BACT